MPAQVDLEHVEVVDIELPWKTPFLRLPGTLQKSQQRESRRLDRQIHAAVRMQLPSVSLVCDPPLRKASFNPGGTMRPCFLSCAAALGAALGPFLSGFQHLQAAVRAGLHTLPPREVLPLPWLLGASLVCAALPVVASQRARTVSHSPAFAQGLCGRDPQASPCGSLECSHVTPALS